MPKIPTYTATARPTAEVGTVRTGFQVSPTATAAAALLPAAKATDDYFLKQRDNNEKLEARKKFYEMKAESDRITKRLENNPDEFQAVNIYNNEFGTYRQSQLSGIKNKRVKQKLQTLLDIDHAETVYKIKSKSFKAFELQDLSSYNTDQTTFANAYTLETNPDEKQKHKQKRIDRAIEFEKTHVKGKTWLQSEFKKIETDSVILDVDKAIAQQNYGEALRIIKQADKSKVDSEQLQKKIIQIQKGGAEFSETSFHVNNMLKGTNSTIGANFKNSSDKKVKQGLEKVLFDTAGKNNLGPEQTFAYVDETFAKNGEVSPTYKNLMEAGYNTGSTTTFDSAADIPTTLVQAVKAAEIADRLGRLNTYTTNEQERFYKNVIVAKKILGMDDYQAIKAAKDFETKYEASIIKGASKQRRRTLNQIEDKFSEVKATNIGDLRLYGEKLYNMYVVMGLDDNKAQKQVLEDIKNNITIVDDYAYLKRDIEAFKSIGSIGSVSPLKKYIVEQKLEKGEDSDDYYLRHNGGGQFELRRKLDTSPVYDKENNPTIYYAKDLKQLSIEQFKSFEEKERKETIEKQKRLQEARRETPDAVAP